jgi:hypothetical protein
VNAVTVIAIFQSADHHALLARDGQRFLSASVVAEDGAAFLDLKQQGGQPGAQYRSRPGFVTLAAAANGPTACRSDELIV